MEVNEKRDEKQKKDNETKEIVNKEKSIELNEKKVETKTEKDEEKEIENIEETKTKESKKEKIKTNKNKIIIISIVSIIILLIAMFLCSIFALLNMNNNKIIKGITINQISVENLTKEEALEKIEEEANKNLEKDINVKYNDFEYSIKLAQIEVKYKIEEAVEKAFNTGRSNNIFIDNYTILKTRLKKENLDLEYEYNEKLLDEIIDDITVKIPEAVVEPSYYIENEKLYISKGTKGNTIEKEALKKEILERIEEEKNEDIILEIYEVEPSDIDIEKIYNEVYTEPKDAYYTKDPFEIFPHVNGINFDKEAAKAILEQDKEEYEIPLIITTPKITTNKIGTEAFPDMLSTFSTRYDASNTPRTTNLKLAMQKLNEVVVSPGETFSYNKTLGKRTAEAGYKEAGGFAGGKVVQTLAGGICQISSTLYDAVVYANLDIVERHNHMFLAGYVGAGKDATVVYGIYDFKFKNTRKYPIMIKTSIGSGVAQISIYGVKEEVEYEVEISSKILSYIPYKVVYETDNSLASGKEKVAQNGMNGCKSITYKILKLNGAQVSSTVLSTDTYDPMNKIIKRGPSKTTETSTVPKEETTKTEPEPTPETEPTPTPAPEPTPTEKETNVITNNTAEGI